MDNLKYEKLQDLLEERQGYQSLLHLIDIDPNLRIKIVRPSGAYGHSTEFQLPEILGATVLKNIENLLKVRIKDFENRISKLCQEL